LAQVVHALGLLSFGLGLGQRRQEHSSQNGNDGNDHEQFNQSKSEASAPRLTWGDWGLHENDDELKDLVGSGSITPTAMGLQGSFGSSVVEIWLRLSCGGPNL
jgi:hypothetical protein